jgi:hypothetical protein
MATTVSPSGEGSGKWTFDGKTLVLGWEGAAADQVQFKGPGRFENGYLKMQLASPPNFDAVIGRGEQRHR